MNLALDTSAVIAVLFEDEGHERLLDALGDADVLAIGVPTLLETGMVAVGRLDLRGRALVSQFLEHWSVVVTPFEGRHWHLAMEAFIRFGKGRHPARLNLGDCMTYATAQVAEAPLLFVGDDFAKTDLTPALARR